ncbi:MAG: PorV/PorQ family protein [bacterium]|nr:PorV/PorQ family protein [bacterium]
MRNFIFVIILSFLAPPLHGLSVLDSGFQARPSGMGNAFIGLCDDSSALYYNPAALHEVPKHQVSAGYSTTFAMADNVSFSYVLPGLNYPSFLVKNPRPDFGVSILVNTLMDSGIRGYSAPALAEPGAYIKGKEYDYSENLIMLGMGTRVKNLLMMQWSLGAGVKYFSRKLADASASGIGLDLGLNLKHKFFNFGIAARNLAAKLSGDGLDEDLPVILRFGTLLKVQRIIKNIFSTKDRKPEKDTFNVPSEFMNFVVNPVIDAELTFEDTSRFDLFTGLEAWLNELLALRFGYNTIYGFGFGGSVQISRFRLDYSCQPHDELENTHKVSGSFYF